MELLIALNALGVIILSNKSGNNNDNIVEKIQVHDIVTSCWDNEEGEDNNKGKKVKKASLILFAFRVVCVLIFWMTLVEALTLPASSAFCAFTDNNYTNRNNIDNVKCYHFVGFTKLSTFTTWSWILLGLYFHFTIIATILNNNNNNNNKYSTNTFAFITLLLFEMSFAISLLVCLTVELILVPTMKKNLLPSNNDNDRSNSNDPYSLIAKDPSHPFYFSAEQRINSFYARPSIVMHNVNVVLMIIELLLNSSYMTQFKYINVHISYTAFCIGLPYLIFANIWFRSTGVYYYFFIDHRQPIAPLGVLFIFGVICMFLYFGKCIASVMKPRTTTHYRHTDLTHKY